MADADLYYLVYLSAALDYLDEAEAERILAASRRNNERHGITGMLLYADGAFIQLLEGPKAAVRDVFERIKGDARHRRVTVMLEGPIAQRHFPSWSMGFRSLDRETLAQLPGVNDFMSGGDTVERLSREPRHAYKLLTAFRDQRSPSTSARP